LTLPERPDRRLHRVVDAYESNPLIEGGIQVDVRIRMSEQLVRRYNIQKIRALPSIPQAYLQAHAQELAY